jgi:hypothetical protein
MATALKKEYLEVQEINSTVWVWGRIGGIENIVGYENRKPHTRIPATPRWQRELG